MDFDFSPIFSGLIGGAVAVWLGSRWKHFLPAADSPSTQMHLRDKYAGISRAANCLFGLGIVLALGLYWFAGVANNEWYPLGLGFGGGCFSILLLMAAAGSLVRGATPSEAVRAYAIAQKTPVMVLLPLLLAGSCLFLQALYSAFA
jgi:hypothetical protein